MKRIPKLSLYLLFFLAAFCTRSFALASAPPLLQETEIQTGITSFYLIHAPFSEFLKLLSPTIGPIDIRRIAPFAVLFTLPYIKFFGLSLWTIRLASVIASMGVCGVFFLTVHEAVLKLSHRVRSSSDTVDQTLFGYLPIIAFLLFAFSEWSIQISRLDVGSNLGLFFLILSVYCLLRAKKYPEIIASLLFSCLSVYSSITFLTPALLVLTGVLFVVRKRFARHTSLLLTSLLFFLLILLPILPKSYSSLTHADDTKTILLIQGKEQAKKRIAYSNNTHTSRLLYNSFATDSHIQLQAIASYIEPRQLFVSFSSNPNTLSPFTGLFSPIILVFLTAGLLCLLLYHKKILLIIFGTSLLIILPRALTQSTTDVFATSPLLLIALLITSYGFLEFLSRFNKRTLVLLVVTACLFFYFSARFLYTYFAVYPNTVHDIQQNYLQAFSFAKKSLPTSTSVVVTDATFGKNLSLFWLFATAIVPFDIMCINHQPTDNIIACYGHYVFVSHVPNTYLPKTIYIQQVSSTPNLAKIIFTSNDGGDKKIGVFVLP